MFTTDKRQEVRQKKMAGLLGVNNIKLVSPSLSTVSSSASLLSHSPPSPTAAPTIVFADWDEIKKKKSTFITAVYRNEHKKVKTMLEECDKNGTKHMKQALLGNYVYDFGTITPLFLSCFLGFETCTEVLIRHGASVNSKFYSPDQAAKEETVDKGNVMEPSSPNNSKATQVVGRAVNLLKNFFVKNDLQAQQQFSTPIATASKNASQKTYVPYIATAIHAACSKNNHSERNVVLLLRHGAEINSIDNLGETPLFYACRHAQEKSISLLLLAGAKKDLKNFDSQTVLDLLAKSKQTELIDFVKKFEYAPEKDPILKWKIENQKREAVRVASKQFLDRRKSMRNPSAFLSAVTSPFRNTTTQQQQQQQQPQPQPLISPRKAQKEESVSQLTSELLEACKLLYESEEHM